MGDAIPSSVSVVGLLQALRKQEVGTRGSIKDLRHAFDILLFTHAATTTVEVDSNSADAFVIREYASLGYYLRQHTSLLQVADGIDAIVDHCVQRAGSHDDSTMSVLRVLVALSGGDSGQSFVDTSLGPNALQLAQQQRPSTSYNRRMGEHVVQSNADLACAPQSLFHMHDTLSHRDAKDMLDAMSALPGHSALQSDFWHEKDSTKPADLFGALQHSSFHRTDSQLIRFDLHLSVPPLNDTPPDLISNALSANKHLPRRQRIVNDTPAPLGAKKPRLDRPLDCNLLFSSHNTVVNIDMAKTNRSAKKLPAKEDLSTSQPILQVWENLGPKKVQVGNRVMLGGSLHGESAPLRAPSNSQVVVVAEAALVSGVLAMLNGIESTLFQRRGFEFHSTAPFQLPTTSRLDVDDLVQVFARTGTLLLRLAALGAHFGQHGMRGGRVLQRMGSALQYFLAGHHAFMLELKGSSTTLVDVWAATGTLRRRMDHVATLFMCQDDHLWGEDQAIASTLPTGVNMLNRVYDSIVQTQFCDPAAAALSMWFFDQLIVPYCHALTQWIFLGEFDDEYLEYSHGDTFDSLACLQHDAALVRAMSETGALLRVTRTVQSKMYYLSSTKWTPLRLVTDHDGLEQYLDLHASNLQQTRAAVQEYSDAQLQAIADSIYALTASSSSGDAKPSHAYEDARVHDNMQRQMKRLKQQLQRKLLDEQVAESTDLRVHQQAKEALLEKEHEREQSAAARETAERGRARLLEIYEGLMAEADRKHRRALWRKARMERKEKFKTAVTKLYRRESSAWCAAAGIDLVRNLDADPMQRKPTRRRSSSAADKSELQLPDKKSSHPNSIRVLQAPGGDSSDTSFHDQKHAVRVLQQPGGDGHAAEDLIYSSNEDGAVHHQNSSVRVLKAPGGGGTDASNAIYNADSEAPVEYSTRVTQEPGGSGAAASRAIYDADDLDSPLSVPQVRVLQEPGGNSDAVENAIYHGNEPNAQSNVVASVRVLQEPGGSGRAVSSLLYPTPRSLEASADPHVNHIHVLQAPGGDGNVVSDLIYGRDDEQYAAPRPSVRVSQAPGGNGDELSDTLYAQFVNLGVRARPSVKVLAPSGGGVDSVSRLVFGGQTDKAPTKQVLRQSSNVTMEWSAAPSGVTRPPHLMEHDRFAPTSLTSDYSQVLETYRQLMDQDDPMEYAPIEGLVRLSMTSPILNQRAFVGTVALTLLRDHVHLMQHLATLHDVMLLSGGLWVERFVQEFVAGLDTTKRVNWGVPGALNDLLASALEEANFNVTESTALFAFRPTDDLETMLGNPTLVPSVDQVLDQIDPVYALPPVLLDMVVSQTTLHQYAALHKHLFRLKAIALSMQSVRRVLRTHPNVATRSCHVRAHVDHHVCSTLVAHCFQAIADEWRRFTRQAETCRDAITFKQLHDRFVGAVWTRCFLDRSSSQVQLAIQACLHQVAHAVEAIQNNATRPVALKRVLEHLATSATDGKVMALCSELTRDPSPAAQELLLRLDFAGFYATDKTRDGR